MFVSEQQSSCQITSIIVVGLQSGLTHVDPFRSSKNNSSLKARIKHPTTTDLRFDIDRSRRQGSWSWIGVQLLNTWKLGKLLSCLGDTQNFFQQHSSHYGDRSSLVLTRWLKQRMKTDGRPPPTVKVLFLERQKLGHRRWFGRIVVRDLRSILHCLQWKRILLSLCILAVAVCPDGAVPRIGPFHPYGVTHNCEVWFLLKGGSCTIEIDLNAPFQQGYSMP